MNFLFDQQFISIRDGLAKRLKKTGQDWKFSIIGTPLMKSNYLIIGNNWGGVGAGDSQIAMPLCNDILAYPTISTYKGYIDFFLKIFDDDKLKTINFFNELVYTNGNFLRSPNESEEFNELLNDGYDISRDYLSDIIELVAPSIIICFGNSERSGTSAVAQAIGIEEPFWTQKTLVIEPTSNNWSTYLFKKETPFGLVEVFSFPHSSKFNFWKKGIEQNPIFNTLRDKLKL